MEETLQASLNNGEKILWRSGTEAFETLDKTNKPAFIRNGLIGGFIAIVIAIAMIATGGFDRKTLLIIVITFLLCAIPTINTLSDASKLRKIEYIATTERLIVLRDSVQSAFYSQIQAAAFREDEDGHVSLLCGPDGLKAKPQKFREICVVGNSSSDSGAGCVRFCFYAPKDRAALQNILHEKMPSLF